jgi:hypothetical protein
VYSCDIQETLFNIRNTQCLKRALVQNAIDEVEESYDKLNEAYNNIIDAFDVTDDSTTDYYRSLRDKLAIELYLKGTKLGNAINQANNVVKLLKGKAL